MSMSAVLGKSTLGLIDTRQRNLPLLDDTPLALVKYEQLNISKLTMSATLPALNDTSVGEHRVGLTPADYKERVGEDSPSILNMHFCLPIGLAYLGPKPSWVWGYTFMR